MVLAAMALYTVTYLSQDISDTLTDSMWLVDAVEGENLDLEYFNLDAVEDKMFYQINENKTDNTKNQFKWQDKEYRYYAYI